MMSEGLGGVGGTGQAVKADGEVARGGHNTGPFLVRIWERSSSKVTSRIRRFSTHQWPRIQAASWAGVAWAAGRLVMAQTTSGAPFTLCEFAGAADDLDGLDSVREQNPGRDGDDLEGASFHPAMTPAVAGVSDGDVFPR